MRWVTKRQEAYINRFEKELPPPWTDDKIVQSYRFCNVYREQDKVTKWIAANWRDGNDDPELWFALCVGRIFNKIETLSHIGYPRPYTAKLFKRMQDLESSGATVFNAAYIVSTCGHRMGKLDYLNEFVFQPMWEARRETSRAVCRKGASLQEIYAALSNHAGFGSFMAAQVVADLKYLPRHRDAVDWMTFAASGPGSRRGMNRMVGREVSTSWRTEAWHDALMELQTMVNKALPKWMPEKLHAQDVQNCLCEFDKYMRVRLSEGRPKQKFNGGSCR